MRTSNRAVPLIRLGRAAGLLLLAAAVSACLVSSQTKKQTTGTPIGEQTLATIRPGMDGAEVQKLLGPPTTRTSLDEGVEIWRWTYRTETTKTGQVFLLFGTEQTEETSGAVNVELKDGKVVRRWRDGEAG